MKTKYCALDTSTKISGISYWEDGDLKDHVLFDFSKVSDIEERTRYMGKAILSYLDEKSPELIYIEQPKGRQNVELVRKLSRILGIVMGWTIQHDCYYEEVMPSVWRKWVPEFNQGGKERNELKEESIRVCRELFGFEPKTDDEADCVLLGLAMLNRYTSEELFD